MCNHRATKTVLDDGSTFGHISTQCNIGGDSCVFVAKLYTSCLVQYCIKKIYHRSGALFMFLCIHTASLARSRHNFGWTGRF